MLTWVTDINTDISGVRTRDPNMVFGCKPGKDVTIGHSEWHGLYNREEFDH